MLNWIVFWVGSALFGLGGPLQNTNPVRQAEPISNDVADSAKLHVFWGNPVLQGLQHRLPDRARWPSSSTGSSSTGRRSASRCARSASTRTRRGTAASAWAATTSSPWQLPALFAGVGGAVDILGWQYRLAVNDVQGSTIGFLGIAVALLGRNTADRRRALRPAVRCAPERHLDAQPRPGRLQAGAGRQPDPAHPGRSSSCSSAPTCSSSTSGSAEELRLQTRATARDAAQEYRRARSRTRSERRS